MLLCSSFSLLTNLVWFFFGECNERRSMELGDGGDKRRDGAK